MTASEKVVLQGTALFQEAKDFIGSMLCGGKEATKVKQSCHCCNQQEPQEEEEPPPSDRWTMQEWNWIHMRMELFLARIAELLMTRELLFLLMDLTLFPCK